MFDLNADCHCMYVSLYLSLSSSHYRSDMIHQPKASDVWWWIRGRCLLSFYHISRNITTQTAELCMGLWIVLCMQEQNLFVVINSLHDLKCLTMFDELRREREKMWSMLIYTLVTRTLFTVWRYVAVWATRPDHTNITSPCNNLLSTLHKQIQTMLQRRTHTRWNTINGKLSICGRHNKIGQITSRMERWHNFKNGKIKMAHVNLWHTPFLHTFRNCVHLVNVGACLHARSSVCSLTMVLEAVHELTRENHREQHSPHHTVSTCVCVCDPWNGRNYVQLILDNYRLKTYSLA